MKKKIIVIIINVVILMIQPLSAETWFPSKRLTWNSGNSQFPQLAVDSNNHIHVVWNDYTPGNLEIYYKKGIQ